MWLITNLILIVGYIKMILNLKKKNKTTVAITEIEFFDGLQNAIL